MKVILIVFLYKNGKACLHTQGHEQWMMYFTYNKSQVSIKKEHSNGKNSYITRIGNSLKEKKVNQYSHNKSFNLTRN